MINIRRRRRRNEVWRVNEGGAGKRRRVVGVLAACEEGEAENKGGGEEKCE